jgi:hypothetical protein
VIAFLGGDPDAQLVALTLDGAHEGILMHR